jgi:hypothetical protein
MMPKALARAALLSALPLLCGCAARQSGTTAPGAAEVEPIPALSVPPFGTELGHPFTFFGVTLYLQAPAPAEVRALVEPLRDKHFPGLHVLDREPEEPDIPIVIARPVTAEDMPPPTLEELEYFGKGLTPAQTQQVAGSPHGLSLIFVDDARHARTNQARQSALVMALAEQLGGYIWDFNTRQLFTRESFEPRLDSANPSVLDHLTIHAYRDGELLRMVTLGMAKYGLPDVEVNHVAANDADATGGLLNIFCALLVEGERPDEEGRMVLALEALRDAKLLEVTETMEGAQRRAEVLVRRTKGQEGDMSEDLLELFFGEADDRFVHERRQAALASFFGSTMIQERAQ